MITLINKDGVGSKVGKAKCGNHLIDKATFNLVLCVL